MKKLIAVMLLVLVSGFATGCGSRSVAVTEYERFSAMIQRGDMGSAWSMLAPASQQTFGSQSEFEKAANALKATAFAPTSKLRNTGFEGRNKDMPFGVIHTYDDKGVKTGEAGRFSLIKDGNSWRVLWLLATSVRDTTTIPGTGG